jgi:outer membrane protein assembly factor BamD (BamD/ComL family)
MDEVQSLYEKKIDAMMSKMFGDADSQLKAITKMSLMSNVLTEDMKQTLIALKEHAMKDAELINNEMTMTLDSSGNVVPVIFSITNIDDGNN